MVRTFAAIAAAAVMTEPAGGRDPDRLAFRGSGGSEFAFDTGVVRGALRAGGQSIGLMPLIHVPSGRSLAKGPGVFNHYRVFTRGMRYGYGARRWPSTAELRTDGSVEVLWAGTTDRPFEMRALYRWVAPNMLDLETAVQATEQLDAFEVFLSSYFEPAFEDSRVWAAQGPAGEAGPLFVAAERKTAQWQAFPRDAEAIRTIEDGRWALPPSPIAWTVMGAFAEPAALRRDPENGLVVLMMSEREECFAVFTPYGTEPHFSSYMSLFGRVVRRGETARAHSRLVILQAPTDADIRQQIEAYRARRAQ